MKKFFWTMCAIILATTSCQIGGDDDGGTSGGGSSNSSKNGYEVGQLYESGSVKGVVFQVDSKGKHGKIVSLTESGNTMTWDDARAWCNGQGEGWYLPTLDELWVIYRKKKAINKTLEEVKGAKVLSDYDYWSSDENENDDEQAYTFDMQDSNTYSTYKNNAWVYVRAVRAF